MQDERFLPIGAADPLRFIDPRFEPHDPLFDPEEPAPRTQFRKRRRAAVVAVAATIACGGSAKPAMHASDSILVQLEPDAAPPPRAHGADSGPAIVPLSVVSSGDAPLLRVPLDPGDDPAEAAAAAADAPGVAFAEPVYVYRAARTPDDPRFKDLWGFTRISLPAAWSATVGDRDVAVAVIDDGIALDHPDLRPNLWTNPQEIAGNGADDDGDGIVDDIHGASFVGSISGDPSPAASADARFHGTHVAGIVGAAGDNDAGVAGVNWKVSLMALRALGPEGGRSDDLARAIDYAVDHGARVINASWSGEGASRVVLDAVERAATRGVLFVSAAGNDGARHPAFPANIAAENVISVGASTPDDLLASFSNRGALVAAPGVGILSTTAPGQYERYDGTSMASAHVAGVAALLWSAFPEAGLSQVRQAILTSAQPIDGVEYGRVDAAIAMEALRHEIRPARGALELSRASLSFTARPGRIPRSQTVKLRVAGGGARKWWAQASNEWIVLPATSGKTPARVTVRVDPAGLAGTHGEGSVIFVDDAGQSVTLSVSLDVGGRPSIAVRGEGCESRGGVIHVRAGSGCELRASDGESNGVQWRLPGGELVGGARLFGHFVRKGEYQLLVSSDEGQVDPLAVVIE